MQLTKVRGMNPQGESWSPSLDELLSPKLQVVDRKEDATGTIFAKVKDNYRKKENIEEIYGLVFDFDKSDFNIMPELVRALGEYEGVVTTTFSNDPRNEKYCNRAFVLCDPPFKPEHAEHVWNEFVDSNQFLSLCRDKGILDPSSKDVGRFFYDFSCPKEREDEAYSVRLGGSPYKVTTPKQEEVNNTSSPDLSIFESIPKGLDVDTKAVGQVGKNLLKGSSDGSRHNDAVALISLLLSRGFSVQDAKDLMKGWNQTCTPPRDESVVMLEVEDVAKRYYVESFRGNDPVPTPKELMDIHIESISFEDLSKAPPPRKWLIDNFIPQGIVGGVVAQGGTGKSFFALQLCSCVASGFMLYNKWSIGNRGKVVYISGEETSEEIRRRLYFLNKRLPDLYKRNIANNLSVISFADKFYPFIQRDRDGNIIITPYVEELTSKLLMAITDPISLIFVDPISRFRDVDENDNTAGTRFVQALQQIRTGLNEDNSCLVAHHGNKGSGVSDTHHQNDSRGGSAVVDGMRFMLKMSHLSKQKQKDLFGTEPSESERYVDLTVIKTNYTKRLDPIYLKVEDEGVLVPCNNLVGQHLDLMILELIDKTPCTQSHFKTMYGGKDGTLGLAERPLVNKLKELKDGGFIDIPPNYNMVVLKKGMNLINQCKSSADDDE